VLKKTHWIRNSSSVSEDGASEDQELRCYSAIALSPSGSSS
jgi:hypothetical protein